MKIRNRLIRILLVNVLSILLFAGVVIPTSAETNNKKVTKEAEMNDKNDISRNLTAGIGTVLYDISNTISVAEVEATEPCIVQSESIEEDSTESENQKEYGPAYDENLQRAIVIDYEEPPYGPAYDIKEDTIEEAPLYKEVENYTMYINALSGLKVRSTPDTTDDTNVINIFPIATELTIIGETDSNWVAVRLNDEEIGFVCSDYIQDTIPDTEEITYNHNWSGPVLNRKNGVVYGPNGKETYYNLPMKGVIKYMRAMGLDGRVWTRSDGAKMYENYVMIAADLSKYPKGSLVEISLGTGIVVDTGGFVTNGSGVAFDVATAW